MFRNLILIIMVGVMMVGTVCAQEVLNVDTLNILAGGKVVASGYEGMPYYIYEGDFNDASFLTRNGQLQDPAYVGVLRNRRMVINRALFYGGNVFEDGGWFDSTARPVEFQIMVNPGDAWTTAATVATYPSLDGTDMAAATVHTSDVGGAYEITFNPPLSCVGFRVAGKGASGNNPSQSFISIDQLRAFGELREAVNTYTPPPLDGALAIGSDFHHPLERGTAGEDVLIDGYPETVARCQEQDAFEFNAFFGFYSANPLTLRSVSFVHGPLTESGGWFNTETSKPRVEIRRAVGYPWEQVGTIDSYPNTNGDTFRTDLPADINTRVFMYTFPNPTVAVGVRFIGNGSFNIDEIPFIQCGELMYEGTGNVVYTGPLGTGRDASGNPFRANANGQFFIQGEWGRSINEAYQIVGHGGVPSGLIARANFGPTFNRFSQQIIEFDIDVTDPGDYFVYTQVNTEPTWGDSFYATFDDQDPLTPDGVTNDFRWVPPAGTPAGSNEILERSIIRVDAGYDNWSLDPGTHTFRLGLREPRSEVDWILITKDGNLDINAFQDPSTPPTEVSNFALY